MDHPQTPRILAPHLSNFQHRIVRMLGKVVQLRGETAVIDAGGQVDVVLTRVCVHALLVYMKRERKKRGENDGTKREDEQN